MYCGSVVDIPFCLEYHSDIASAFRERNFNNALVFGVWLISGAHISGKNKHRQLFPY